MAEATNICTYDQEYLSLLARRGLLQAEKIGRKWYTTREWLNVYLQENRPNEVIRNEKKLDQKTEEIFRNPRILKWSLISIGLIGVIAISSYWYMARRISQLEKKTAENAFIFNTIEKIPTKEGNTNIDSSDIGKPDN